MKMENRKECRARRHERIRSKVRGSAVCPRLAIMVSNRHMYAQMIDDGAGHTLAALSDGKEGGASLESARALGRALGEAARGKGLSCFVVDRGGFRFHGRVKAIVDGALEAGLTNVKEAK